MEQILVELERDEQVLRCPFCGSDELDMPNMRIEGTRCRTCKKPIMLYEFN